MKTLYKLIGIVLELVGRTFHLSHYQFIGHYLAGTGTAQELPKYTWEAVRTATKHLDTSNYYRPFCFSTLNNLFSTVGKVYLKLSKSTIYVKDIYMFYPNCAESQEHFSDCKCKDKRYTDFTVFRTSIPSKIAELVKVPFSVIRINKFIRIQFSNYEFSIEVNDEFWVDKGKPFNVYSEISRTGD